MANMEAEVLSKLQSAQQKINKIAREYYDGTGEQKIALQQKIIDKVLLYVLKIDESSNGGECNTFDRMYEMEKRSEKANNSKEYFNAEVLFKTVNYCLQVYNPLKGDFMNMFNLAYKKRNNEAFSEEKNKKYIQGFSQSKREREMVRNMNKLLETLSREDDKYVGKRVEDLSKNELDDILSHFDFGGKDKEKIIDIVISYRNVNQNTSSLEAMSDRFAQDESSDDEYVYGTYEVDCNEAGTTVAIIESVFGRANKNQKRYFSCFVVQDLINSGTSVFKEKLLPYIDEEFFSLIYIKEGNEKITNKMIADFLAVKEPAVSKKRSDYERLFTYGKRKIEYREK